MHIKINLNPNVHSYKQPILKILGSVILFLIVFSRSRLLPMVYDGGHLLLEHIMDVLFFCAWSLISTFAIIKLTLAEIKEVGDRSSRNSKWYRSTPRWIERWFYVSESKIHIFYHFQFVIAIIFFFFGLVNTIAYNICGCDPLIGKLLANVQLHSVGINIMISMIVTSIIKNN